MSRPHVIMPHPIRAVVMLDGTTAVASEHQTRTYDFVIPGALNDIVGLLDTCAKTFDREGVVVLDFPPLVPELPLSTHRKVDMMETLASTAAAAQWQLGAGAIAMEQQGKGSGWMTFSDLNKERATVHVGILPWMNQAETPLFRTDGSWKPSHIATNLARYHQLLGVAWRNNAGSTGSALMRALYSSASDVKRRGQPRWRQDRWKADSGILGRGDIVWKRPLSAAEKKMRYVHEWDMRTAYLAAASVADIGWGSIEQTGHDADGTAAGYYQLLLTTAHKSALYGNKMLPPVINSARMGSNSTIWVTQPVLAYIRSLGLNPEIIDSYTAERSGRYARPWAERIRDAIADAEDAKRPQLRETLKATFSHSIGLWQAEGGRIYRRDWGHTIEDTAAVSMLRRIAAVVQKTEETPIEVNTDAVYYASNEPDARKLPHGELLGCGPYIGNMVYEGCTEMAVYLTKRRKAKK
jgi:hypothetical protein